MSLWAGLFFFFSGMFPKEHEMEQTSCFSVSSGPLGCCWGALWAALLADKQVCSGWEPLRHECGGETDPISPGCPGHSSCPPTLLEGLRRRWWWELLLSHGEGEGPWRRQLLPTSGQRDVVLSPRPSTHCCWDHGGWGVTASPQGTKNSSPGWKSSGGSKRTSFLYEPKIQGTGPKQGRMLCSGWKQHHNPTYHP